MDLAINLEDVQNELAKRDLKHFSKVIYPANVFKEFHESYYRVLTMFAKREIKNLIITIPPQHGKSEGSTRLLPAYLLGKNPNLNIAIGSYNTTFARKFNRSIQRIIDSKPYRDVFPGTTLNTSNVVTNTDRYLRNADEFEIVGHRGSLKVVGRGGPLTGNPVDVMIMDDLYKDMAEGNSPVIRASVIEWYESVVEKRLHNNSQQLIVFTRWHEEDLIGYIESKNEVILVQKWEDLLLSDEDTWVKVNFEAIKESEQNELDTRFKGQALWPEKHGLKKLLKEKKANEHMFNCMNQGSPDSQVGLLYSEFKTYNHLPNTLIKMANYTDVADTGKDYFASACYAVDQLNNIYLVDLIYTNEPLEVTEPALIQMLTRIGVPEAEIESNNGGRGVARNIENAVGSFCDVRAFHQSKNKESRIITNQPAVNKILMPHDWQDKWPKFYKHVTKFKRNFQANEYDDAPDMLTGIIEKSNNDVFTQIVF